MQNVHNLALAHCHALDAACILQRIFAQSRSLVFGLRFTASPSLLQRFAMMMSGNTVCMVWMGTFWGTLVQALPRHARRDITVTVAVPGWDRLFQSLHTVPPSLAHLMMLPLLDVLAGELDSEDVPLAQAARNELLNLAEYLEEDVPVQAYVNDWKRNQIVPLNYLSTVPGADLHTLAALLREMGNFVEGLAVHQHGHRDQPPPGGPIIEQSTEAIFPLPDMHGREL